MPTTEAGHAKNVLIRTNAICIEVRGLLLGAGLGLMVGIMQKTSTNTRNQMTIKQLLITVLAALALAGLIVAAVAVVGEGV